MLTSKAIRERVAQLSHCDTRFSQGELARVAGINRTTFNEFLRGHIALRDDQLAAIELAISSVARRRLVESLQALLPPKGEQTL
jgi:hypothetical protein